MKKEHVAAILCGPVRPELRRCAEGCAWAIWFVNQMQGRGLICDFRAFGLRSAWLREHKILEVPAGYRLAFAHPMDYLCALAAGRRALYALFDPEDERQMEYLEMASGVCESEDIRFYIARLSRD